MPDTWSDLIWNVALEYAPADDRFVYGRISTGFRAGGDNFNRVPERFWKIKEETLINYEVGMKGRYLDQRLQLSATAYYYDFTDYQTTATVPNEPEDIIAAAGAVGPLSTYVNNIPSNEIWGLELEGSFYINERIRLSGFYAFTDSRIGDLQASYGADPDTPYEPYEYTDFLGNVITTEFKLPTDMTGNQMPQQPHHKASLTLSYGIPRVMAGDVELQTTWSYTGTRWPDFANLEKFKIPAYTRWDARASWTSTDQHWTATVFVRNVRDEITYNEFYPLSSFAGPLLGSLTDPRRIGLELRWRL